MADETDETLPRVEVLPGFGLKIIGGDIVAEEASLLSSLVQVGIMESVAPQLPLCAQSALHSIWKVVRDHLASHPCSDPAVHSAANVLNEYFEHRGDWPRMLKCLREYASSGQVPRGKLMQRLATQALEQWLAYSLAPDSALRQKERALAARWPAHH